MFNSESLICHHLIPTLKNPTSSVSEIEPVQNENTKITCPAVLMPTSPLNVLVDL